MLRPIKAWGQRSGHGKREEHNRGLAVHAPYVGEPSKWAGVQEAGQAVSVAILPSRGRPQPKVQFLQTHYRTGDLGCKSHGVLIL